MATDHNTGKSAGVCEPATILLDDPCGDMLAVVQGVHGAVQALNDGSLYERLPEDAQLLVSGLTALSGRLYGAVSVSPPGPGGYCRKIGGCALEVDGGGTFVKSFIQPSDDTPESPEAREIRMAWNEAQQHFYALEELTHLVNYEQGEPTAVGVVMEREANRGARAMDALEKLLDKAADAPAAPVTGRSSGAGAEDHLREAGSLVQAIFCGTNGEPEIRLRDDIPNLCNLVLERLNAAMTELGIER